jgi:hypothetical protein
MVSRFQDAFDGDGDSWYEIGGNIVLGILEGFSAALGFIVEPIIDFFNSFCTHICEVFGIHSPAKKMKPFGKNILLGLLKGITDGWNEEWGDFKTWLSGLPEKIATGFGTLKDNFVSKGKSIITGIKQGWNDDWKLFSKWLGGLIYDVSDGFGSLNSTFVVKGGQIIAGIKQGWKDDWKDFKKWLSGIPDDIAGAIGSLADFGADIMKSFIKGMQSVKIKLPHFSLDGSINPVDWMKKGEMPKLNVNWYAQGGYVGANQPQLAVIGDNKREGEIVSPESKFQEMLNAAAKLNGGSISEDVLYRVMSRVLRENQMVLVPDENGIYKLVKKVNKENFQQTGVNGLVY